MDRYIKEIYNFINDFRSSPSNSTSFINTCTLAINQIEPNNPTIALYKKLLKECPNIPSVNKLMYSNELSAFASDYLNKLFKQNKVKDCFKQGKELKGIIPDNYINNNTILIVDEQFETVETLLMKLLTKTDTKKPLGHNYVTSNNISEIGIAMIRLNDDIEEGYNTYLCAIFNEGFTIDDVDLTELRLAYNALNPDNKPNINMKKIVELLKEQGKDKSECTLYNILEDLSKKYEIVTWPIFAKYCHSKMSDVNSNEGLERIFKIFLNESDYESIDYSQLKDINNKLNLGYTDDDIKNMLRNGTESQYGINFNDFCIRVKEKLNNKK